MKCTKSYTTKNTEYQMNFVMVDTRVGIKTSESVCACDTTIDNIIWKSWRDIRVDWIRACLIANFRPGFVKIQTKERAERRGRRIKLQFYPYINGHLTGKSFLD